MTARLRITAWGTLLLLMHAVQATGAAPVRTTDKEICVAIYDVNHGTTWRSDEASCTERLSPASTFKIPHALIALATGAIRQDSLERWDGARHPRQPAWERNHTVRSAIEHSVVWFFQRTAMRIGAVRMRGFLQRMHYGNADTSGNPLMYWLNGTLCISPNDQLEFLKRFFAATLPVQGEHVAFVRSALVQKPGAVRNSLGQHALDGHWNTDTRTFAKTGATSAADGTSVSWLVGMLQRGGREYLFVSASWSSGSVEPPDATRNAIATFIERGLLDPARPTG